MSFHEHEFHNAINLLDKSAATSPNTSIESDEFQNNQCNSIEKKLLSDNLNYDEKKVSNTSTSSGSFSVDDKEEVDINSMYKTATSIDPNNERNELMLQINERILNMLRRDASNRTCADCGIHLGVVGSTIGSLSEIYVSLCLFQDESSRRLNSLKLNPSSPMFEFERRHKEFQPRKALKPRHKALAVFPYGVFICESCSWCHKSLGSRITSVKSFSHSNEYSWSLEDIHFLEKWGGNTRSNHILERFMPEYWKSRIVPRLRSSENSCSLEEREVFVRAKYESLAFVYPIGPLSQDFTNVKRWEESFQKQKKLSNSLKLWNSVSPRKSGSEDINDSGVQVTPSTNRLVDYFTILGPDPLYTLDEQNKNTVQLVSKVLDCYPKSPHADMKLPDEIARFVFPDGCCASLQPIDPTFFTFVLTLETGVRVYGSALTIYDESFEVSHISKLLRQEMKPSNPRSYRTDSMRGNPDSGMSILNDHVFMPKTLVILSHYPFFQVFRTYLQQLYRISLVQTRLPLERYIANFVSEVPLPPRGKVEVKVGVADKLITIVRPPPNELPFVEVSYRPLFSCLSVSNIMVSIACLLQEGRVVLCSSKYSLLTPVSEALLSLLFPFIWQGCYVPVMPYSMLDVLDAPMPFFVGIHSRYLKNVSPVKRPPGVVFIDLDEDVVHLGTEDDPSCTPSLIPALPEKEANKLKMRLDQHGSSAYLSNKSGIKGQITNGQFARTIPNLEREIYAHQSAPNLRTSTPRTGITPRTKVNPNKARSSMGNYLRLTAFSTADEAFTGGEHRIPISKFASEEGTMLQVRRDSNTDNKEKEVEPAAWENIFDVSSDEVDVFSAEEIRQAFLRFFVSIFKNYEKFLNLSNNNCNHIPFSKAEFLLDCKELSEKSREYLSQVISTQMFERFIEESVNNSEQFEIMFFKESIIQKRNRSKKKALSTSFKTQSFKTPFLSEISKYALTETYSPPSPSNWGLPDDGRMYSYPHFPCKLDVSLFGKKIRTPKVLDEEEQRIRHSSLLSVTSFLATLIKGGSNGPSSLKSAKRLEWAINAIAYRHASSHVDDEENENGTNLDESTDVASTSISTDDLYAAQALISSIRRKQVNVLATVIKIQSLFRMFICRKLYISMKENIVDIENVKRSEQVRHKQQALLNVHNEKAIIIHRNFNMYVKRKSYLRTVQATIKLQACVRGFIKSKEWRRLRYNILRFQSVFRGRRVYFAFDYMRRKIILIQATFKGWSLRKTLEVVLSTRRQQYVGQLFILWRISYTPLVYRSQFMIWVNQWECKSLFLQLLIYEEELQKLWLDARLGKATDEKIDLTKILGENKVQRMDKVMDLLKIMNNTTFFRFVQIRQELQGNIKSIDQHFYRIRHEHILQERMQIYEALSALSSNEQEKIYQLLKIPQNEKKRKVQAANIIWESDDIAELSVRLIIGLLFISDNPHRFFESAPNYSITTESFDSNKASITKSTKKGRKRFHIDKKKHFNFSLDYIHTDFQPRLDVRIRKNLMEALHHAFGSSKTMSGSQRRFNISSAQLHWYSVVACNELYDNNVGYYYLHILGLDQKKNESFYSC